MPDTDSNPSLESLLAQTARGDRRAFQQLYRGSSAHLFGAALRIVQDRSLAEEAVQEAYLQIWNNAGTYRAETAPALAWMATIARYRALDIRRRLPAFQISLDENPALGELPAAGMAPGEGHLEPMLDECLNQLSEQGRQAVLLTYTEGHTHAELARKLKAPLGSVKSWVRRGLLQLRDCLEGKSGARRT